MRTVLSIEKAAHYVREIIVVDNGSDEPVEESLRHRVEGRLSVPLVVRRLTGHIGPIVARNQIAERTKTQYLLSLDDDVDVLSADAISDALDVIASDSDVGAVSFAQASASGAAWPNTMQPARVNYPCYVNAYIGCAVLHRTSVFLELGGYRDALQFYGEEKEYCLRLADAGYAVVYLPDALIAHLCDPSGRDARKYLRYYTRNDCYGAMYNYPWILALPWVFWRLSMYTRTARRQLGIKDRGGPFWIIRELMANLVSTLGDRRAIKWSTVFAWRRNRRHPAPYRTCSKRVEPRTDFLDAA